MMIPGPQNTISYSQSSSLSSGISPRSNYLQGIDGAVKAHEKAHLLALGGYAKGGISYDYLITADGHKYAVGGSVGVDIKPVPGDPEATIRKMRTVRAAALSPTHPSSADTNIASKTMQLEMIAQQELKKEQADTESPFSVGADGSIEVTAGSETKTIASDRTSLTGAPEAVIDNANAIQRDIFISGDMSARNMQRLVQSYVMEMQAQKKLEAQKSNQSGVDISA